jgi:ankyrin repeat protein
MLARSLVDTFRKNTTFVSQRSIVAAIFFDFRYVLTLEEGSTKGLLLRTLLYQILENHPPALSEFQKSLSLMSPFPQRPEDVDDHYYERWLGNALSAASANAQVFIMIDGLDECTPAIQNDLMSCIEPIYKATYPQPRVRLIVSSRWISTMQRVYEEYPTKQIHLEEENAQAIAIYCSSRLYSRLADPTAFLDHHYSTVHDDTQHPLQQVVTALTTRAKGIFLWVRLAIDILVTDYPTEQGLSHNMEEWRNMIQNIPAGLDSLYGTLVNRIPPAMTSVFRYVTAWCMFAVRPLSSDELLKLLQHGTGQADRVLYNEIRSQELQPSLDNLCPGLIEVVPDPLSHTYLVQLVHSTVKEYLLDAGARHVTPIGLAHTLITKACVRYMSHCGRNNSNPSDPLFTYSILNWGYHASVGDSLGIPQESLLDFVHWPSLNCVSVWSIIHQQSTARLSSDQVSNRTSFLHVASQYGLYSTIQALPVELCLSKALNKTDDAGRTPLHYACRFRHTSIVLLLLEHGAQVNATDQNDCTPLHMAVRSGHKEIIKCLLDRGANVRLPDARRDTALQYAVKKGNADTVELLLEKGADPNYLDKYGNSILALAAIKGNEAVAKLALSLKDTKWPLISYGIALTFAAALGLSGLVRSLLLSGLFRDHHGRFVQQAFIAAIVGAREEIARILANFGCNPNVHDHQYGQSALSIAAASGNEPMVLLLLSCGADPNIQDDDQSGNTPIMHAVSHGRPIIVRLLLESGAVLELPMRHRMHSNEGWIFRITSMLLRMCPNGKENTGNTEPSRSASKNSASGSSARKEGNRKSSGSGRKRSRRDQSADGDDQSPHGERVSRRRRCDNQPQFACPFEKRYPGEHDCGPKKNVQRLK